MKKIIAPLIAIILFGSFMVACGSKEEPFNEKITL